MIFLEIYMSGSSSQPTWTWTEPPESEPMVWSKVQLVFWTQLKVQFLVLKNTVRTGPTQTAASLLPYCNQGMFTWYYQMLISFILKFPLTTLLHSATPHRSTSYMLDGAALVLMEACIMIKAIWFLWMEGWLATPTTNTMFLVESLLPVQSTWKSSGNTLYLHLKSQGPAKIFLPTPFYHRMASMCTQI